MGRTAVAVAAAPSSPMMKRLLLSLALVLVSALSASAQQLRLEIADGRVTLEATSVPVGQILAEWARVGGTKIVGADKIAGAPLTLKLVDVTEQQALNILLRQVAGFMAAPRQASATPGASTYDRILILATSSVAPAAASNDRPAAPGTSPAGAGTADTARRFPPRPPNLPPSPEVADEQVDAQVDAADTGVAQPVFTFPTQPGAVAPAQGTAVAPAPSNSVFVPVNPNNGTFVPAPAMTLQPGQNGPTIYNFVPNTNGAPQPTPQPVGPNPGFSVIGSPTPGMIQVPPAPPPAPTPQTPTTRPPGA